MKATDVRNEGIEARLAIKSSAIQYFDQHSKLWGDRYSEPGNGPLLRDRHRAILDLVDDLDSAPSLRFLDVGCGTGVLSFDLARRGIEGVGIDGAASMIGKCRSVANSSGISEQWQFLQADVEHIPVADRSFDAAICCGVIEYLPDDGGLLREVKRVLRPGGYFFLCVTNRFSYSGSLYPIFQKMKQIPGMIEVATAIRGVTAKHGSEMMNLPLEARRHSPGQIRRALVANGFGFEKDKFSGFTVLPGPFNVLFSRLGNGCIQESFDLDRTWLRSLGSSYITCSRVD